MIDTIRGYHEHVMDSVITGGCRNGGTYVHFGKIPNPTIPHAPHAPRTPGWVGVDHEEPRHGAPDEFHLHVSVYGRSMDTRRIVPNGFESVDDKNAFEPAVDRMFPVQDMESLFGDL
jgi:hypothetical protein